MNHITYITQPAAANHQITLKHQIHGHEYVLSDESTRRLNVVNLTDSFFSSHLRALCLCEQAAVLVMLHPPFTRLRIRLFIIYYSFL